MGEGGLMAGLWKKVRLGARNNILKVPVPPRTYCEKFFAPLLALNSVFDIYLKKYTGYPINFEDKRVAQHSTIWRTYMVHIRVKWFKQVNNMWHKHKLFMLNSVWDMARIVRV